MNRPSLDAVVNLAKRRGFVYQSAEIYGGLRSAWDYGPLGVELKENIKRAWWRSMVQLRDDIVGLDSSVILNTKVWEASGHLDAFSDPLVECLNCHHRFRKDHIGDSCPDCGNKEFTDPRDFNLMFKTNLGPVEEEGSVVYLRPETAQGIFINFKQVAQSTRRRLPFGIAQVGKAFRNEITPGNFIYRTYEFEQMEMEYFVKPGQDEEAMEYWIRERMNWYRDLGIREESLRVREHEKDELSHYSKRTVDIEFQFPWGWGELEGIANRPTDLNKHQEMSGEDLTYFDTDTGDRYLPYVIEPAAGATRAMLAFLVDAYSEEEAPSATGKMEKRTVLKLHKDLAPFKTAVLPLSRHETLVPKAKQVADLLRPRWMVDYDDAGSIGKRYRRHDEIGTPLAVTIDFDTLNDEAVTVRERDSMQQERIPIEKLIDTVQERMS